MNLYTSRNESTLVLIYPNGQRLEVDHFLQPIEFKKCRELVGTHCIDSRDVDETKDTVTVQYFKTPQLINEFELINRNDETEGYFIKTLERHREFIDQSKVIQILNLYCVFDKSLEKELVISEKVLMKS